VKGDTHLRVTELPLVLEPVSPDPFIADLQTRRSDPGGADRARATRRPADGRDALRGDDRAR
jgi:hypothetical protein